MSIISLFNCSRWIFRDVAIVMISVLLLPMQMAWAGGQAVGNGGDGIRCLPSDQNSFNGLYVLDYIESYNPKLKLIEDKGATLERLWQIIYDKGMQPGGLFDDNMILVNLANSLKAFYRDFESQIQVGVPDYLSQITWAPQSFGLLDIQDEDLIQRIPLNCQSVIQNSSITRLKIFQIVVRLENDSSFFFKYDPRMLKELFETSQFQFSYLIVHEWMREIIGETWNLRDVVNLIHSEQFLNASAQDAVRMLTNSTGKIDFIPKKGFKILNLNTTISNDATVPLKVNLDLFKAAP
jgi:hypothetical protein